MTWLLVGSNAATALLTALCGYLWGRHYGLQLREDLMSQLNADPDAEPAPKKKPDRSGWMVWVVFGLVLIGVGVLGIVNNLEVKHAQDDLKQQASCSAAYLNGSGPLAQARDNAQQTLWDEFAVSLRLGQAQTPKQLRAVIFQLNAFVLDKPIPADSTAEDAYAAIKAQFAADLEIERAKAKALSDYREHHVPKEACPQ